MLLAVALQIAAYNCVSPTVLDGDTLRCPGGPRLRLARIDAPELNGPNRCIDGERPGWSNRCRGTPGRDAREYLRTLVDGRRMACQLIDASPTRPGFQRADPYGRPVVRCSVDGVGDLGEAMISAGHARRWP